MTRNLSRERRIYLFTPTIRGGSFETIMNYFNALSNKKIYIFSIDTKVARDNLRKKYNCAYFYVVPLKDVYSRYVNYFENHALLKILFFPILYLIQIVTFITYIDFVKDGDIIIFNGFTNGLLSIILSFLKKFFNIKLIISYHGSPLLNSKVDKILANFISRFVDYIFVNSIFTSYIFRKYYKLKTYYLYHEYDLSLYNIPCKFFNQDQDKITIIYPGPRINYEKSVIPLIIFAIKHCNSSLFRFVFLGYDELNILKSLDKFCHNIRYLGFITDYEKYINLILTSDICWSNAEITYVTRPAIECLLLGKPVIIPDRPAVNVLTIYKPIKRYLPKHVYIISYRNAIKDQLLIYRSIIKIIESSYKCIEIKRDTVSYIERLKKFNKFVLDLIVE